MKIEQKFLLTCLSIYLTYTILISIIFGLLPFNDCDNKGFKDNKKVNINTYFILLIIHYVILIMIYGYSFFLRKLNDFEFENGKNYFLELQRKFLLYIIILDILFEFLIFFFGCYILFFVYKICLLDSSKIIFGLITWIILLFHLFTSHLRIDYARSLRDYPQSV